MKYLLLILITMLLGGCTFNLAIFDRTESENRKSYGSTQAAIVSLKNQSGTYMTTAKDDLIIDTSPDLESMYITNIEGCQTGGQWETVVPVKRDWLLDPPENSGKVKIFAKFKSTSGVLTKCYEYSFDFVNDLLITIDTPIDNQITEAYEVFHGSCKAGSTISVESTDIVHIPDPVLCDGAFHIGVPFDGNGTGLKKIKIVSTDVKGYRKSLERTINFQRNGFNSGSGFDAFTYDVKVDSTLNKVYVCGQFTTYNGVSSPGIIRLNMDGSIDNTFISQGFGSWPDVMSMAIDPVSHKIYVGGTFTTYGASGRANLIRLNTDGSLDSTFNPTAPNDGVTSIELDPVTLKLYIGGWFTNYAGSGANRISRLNTDGTRDVTFNVGTGVNSDVTRIQYDTNQNYIYVSGYMDAYGATTGIPGLFRVSTNGSIDNMFKPGLNGTNTPNSALYLPSISSVWTVGSWFRFPSGSSANIAAFNSTTGANQLPWTVANNLDGEGLDMQLSQDGNSVYVIGNFSGIGDWNNVGTLAPEILKVNLTGQVDKRFQTGVATQYRMGWWGRIAMDYANNRMFVVGDISDYNYSTRNGLFVISLDDGSLR